MRRRGFNAQVQLKLTVDPIHPFMIPTKALHIAQIEEAQFKTPCSIALCQLFEPLRDDGVLM